MFLKKPTMYLEFFIRDLGNVSQDNGHCFIYQQ